MMQHLDGGEIRLCNHQNRINQMIKNDEEVDCGKDGDFVDSYFNLPLDYFTAIQHAINHVVVEKLQVSKTQNAEPSQAVVSRQQSPLYSKQLVTFIEHINKALSFCKQTMERNLAIYESYKHRIGKKYQLENSNLKKEIEILRSKLIEEDQILSEGRLKDMRDQVEEFL